MGIPVEHSKLLIWSKGTGYDAVRDTTDADKINFINPSNNNLDGMLYETKDDIQYQRVAQLLS